MAEMNYFCNHTTLMAVSIFIIGLLSCFVVQDISAGADPAEDYRIQICKQNGNPNAFEKFKDAQQAHKSCFTSLCSMGMLYDELVAVSPTQNLTEVFSNYCRKKVPSVIELMNNFTADIEPCLEDYELANTKVLQNILESQTSFLCHENRSYGTEFIAAGGLKCFGAEYRALQECIPTGDIHPKSHYKTHISLLLQGNWSNTQHCKSIYNLRTCWVTELKGCKNSTIAEIADSFLKYVMELTPCGSLASRIDESILGVISSTVFMVMSLWLL